MKFEFLSDLLRIFVMIDILIFPHKNKGPIIPWDRIFKNYKLTLFLGQILLKLRSKVTPQSL